LMAAIQVFRNVSGESIMGAFRKGEAAERPLFL